MEWVWSLEGQTVGELVCMQKPSQVTEKQAGQIKVEKGVVSGVAPGDGWLCQAD